MLTQFPTSTNAGYTSVVALNLTDPGTLRDFLARHGLVARKGLGQHFLCSSAAVGKIVGALAACRGLVEVGPGPGVLTAPLSEVAAKIIAIELDERMVAALAESAPRAEIRQEDALTMNLPALLDSLPEPRGVVSNLPYYITGPLLTRVAEARAGFAIAVLMMQKEVANRVLAPARTPERGSLSVYLQLQFEIAKVALVPAGAFLPPPKVDSTVLAFVPRPEVYAPELFRLVRLAFAQPRKTLANNLVAGYRVSREAALEWQAQAGLGEKARPQELTNDEWVRLGEGLPA